jgi:hypothetical protein
MFVFFNWDGNLNETIKFQGFQFKPAKKVFTGFYVVNILWCMVVKLSMKLLYDRRTGRFKVDFFLLKVVETLEWLWLNLLKHLFVHTNEMWRGWEVMNLSLRSNCEMVLTESSETFFWAEHCSTCQRSWMPTSGKLNLKGPVYSCNKVFCICNLH